MVTTIADRTLVAYDAASGKERWRAALGREPRGLAISPDGTRALVAYLQTGTVDQIRPARDARASSTSRCRRSARRGAAGTAARRCRQLRARRFAVAFMGDHEAVVPFQRETPVQIANGSNTGSYGGGFESPITHQLAFLGLDGDRTLQTTAHDRRSTSRARSRGTARTTRSTSPGMGTDSILQIQHASQASVAVGLAGSLTSGDKTLRPRRPRGHGRRRRARVVLVHAQRRARRLRRRDRARSRPRRRPLPGPTLVASTLSQPQHDGLVLFHSSATPQISQRGGLACASCHPDGRDDGLSWKHREEHAADAAARRPARRHAPVQVGRRRSRSRDQPDDRR